jgi:hypothetical protein
MNRKNELNIKAGQAVRIPIIIGMQFRTTMLSPPRGRKIKSLKATD